MLLDLPATDNPDVVRATLEANFAVRLELLPSAIRDVEARLAKARRSRSDSVRVPLPALAALLDGTQAALAALRSLTSEG